VLGRFLEFSLETPDIRDSLDFYTRLGFSQAEVGEAWPHPYAVVTDGRIYLGLHQSAIPAPSITFVKPNLFKNLQPLEQLGLELEFRRLGNDVFNEVGWYDPSGQLIRLIEARTFSPAKRLGNEKSRCGYFIEIALPTPNIEASKLYWEQFGFVGIDASDNPMVHVACTSDYLDLGLYESQQLRRSTLHFEVDDVSSAVANLFEFGLSPTGEIPSALSRATGAMFIAPEGTPILLTSP
jgi:catechol 2,3-dioxygenase-like lactoylglutathione lyase family enzyme